MTQTKPIITGTTHTLPFDKLSAEQFERLCLWLVQREGYERAQHLGAKGSEQGRDITAWREGQLWAFQCKRVVRFGPSDALKEVEKVIALSKKQRPVGLIFLVTCDVNVNTRQQACDRCAEKKLACDFWVGTELDEKVKRHPDIMSEFFQVAPVYTQAEILRERELAYLDELLARYGDWGDHYTPLPGIVEVRDAIKDGPPSGLPMPLIPPEFELLEEYGFGERVEVRRLPVEDLRAAVTEHRRILLLGEPGSGKTTTLWQLAYEYATAAREDGQQPLPLLVRLSKYIEPGPIDAFLARCLGPLAPYLETYLDSGRLLLLLDGLNEMPQADYADRVQRIREVLDNRHQGTVVVTCRKLDYEARQEKLQKLQEVEIKPLDETRMRTFLRKYLGDTDGEDLFWVMAGGDEVRTLWNTWQQAGGSWAEFWAPEERSGYPRVRTSWTQRQVWAQLRREPPALLVLGRIPYLLKLTAEIYRIERKKLPANRAGLFAAFVGILLEREKERRHERWIDADLQQDALAALAYAMQAEWGSGTTVERALAVARLSEEAPDCDAELLLYLGASANLLEADDATVRFYHQLLQEYFAARELGRRLDAGEALSRYWPPERWWETSGWEETAILLAGMRKGAAVLLEKLADANPVVAARCLLESGVKLEEATRRGIVEVLLARMSDGSQPAVARVQCGSSLGRLGDPRFRDDAWHLLDETLLGFAEIPAGSFLMGSDKSLDPDAYDDEVPQHAVELPTYYMARYPVTLGQFRIFVQDSGYQAEGAWEEYSGVDNQPAVGVTWYDALVYCRWLTERLRSWNGTPEPLGTLLRERGWQVQLPTEAEWEKAARGTDGRIYPWGEEFDPQKCYMEETGGDTVSTVGCFPGGASPYGVEDLSGNVWEWTRTLWGKKWGKPEYTYPYSQADGRENLEAGDETLRVLRGASFLSPRRSVRCAVRREGGPNLRSRGYGFRVVVAPIPPGL